MIIVSVSENKDLEKRISITPEISKKYINLGFEVHLSENYGDHLGFKDDEYKSQGVKISSDEKKVTNTCEGAGKITKLILNASTELSQSIIILIPNNIGDLIKDPKHFDTFQNIPISGQISIKDTYIFWKCNFYLRSIFCRIKRY